jgi:hypothetical protein
MSERTSTHLALAVSLLAVLVAVFGDLRRDDKDVLERVARLEVKVDFVHETCCSEVAYAGEEGRKELLSLRDQGEEILWSRSKDKSREARARN